VYNRRHNWQIDADIESISTTQQQQHSINNTVSIEYNEHTTDNVQKLQLDVLELDLMPMTHAAETGTRKLASVSSAGFSRQLQNFWRQKPTGTNKKSSNFLYGYPSNSC